MSVDMHSFSFTRKRERNRKLLIVFFSIIFVLILLQFVLMYIIRPLFISSSSMGVQIEKNTAVFILPLDENRPFFLNTDTVDRGTVVSLKTPEIITKNTFQRCIDFITAMFSLQKYKPYEKNPWGDSELYRIIGMPGDTIYINDFIAHIRPTGASHFLTEFELSPIDYTVVRQNIPFDWNMSLGVQGMVENIVLQENEYYVLCDNRTEYIDSRIFGPITGELIAGRVIMTYFPFNDIAFFE
ncbi:MAG: signal peptidase I [Spirochaetales bacterium]